MYIDPNTGGMLFQVLACICPLIFVVILVVAIVIYFVRKGKNDQKPNSTKSPNL
jgi:heme/copper-type cytochrome/quinol oxidase subunit 2